MNKSFEEYWLLNRQQILNGSPMKNELLNWLVSALVAIVAFVICTWVKTVTSNVRSLTEIEEEIKRKCREEYEKKKLK